MGYDLGRGAEKTIHTKKVQKQAKGLDCSNIALGGTTARDNVSIVGD